MTSTGLGGFLGLRQGGDLRDLATNVDYIDLGTCVNRYGPPPEVYAALERLDLREIRAHPYGAEERFVSMYADYLGVDPGCLVAGRGITEFIRALGHVLGTERVAVVTPDYTDTIKIFPVHLPPASNAVDTVESRFERVLDGMAAYPYVVLSNPNNPLGLYIDRSLLLEACRGYPDSALIVDEAFIEFIVASDRRSMVHADVENLVVLRSPNKLFGIAGARTGALWTRNEELLSRIRGWQLNWPLSYLDALVACAALEAREWADRTRERLLATAALLERLLMDLFSSVVMDVPVHYRFVPADDPEAAYQLFLRHGLVVRAFSGNERGRIPGVRVTAPTETEFDAVKAALS